MSSKKAAPVISPGKLALYDKLISSNPLIERKGATLPYTAVNGNMFSFLSKEGELSIRLAGEDREKFIKKYKTQLSVQHGVVMKEYVVVPDSLLKKTKELQMYLDASLEYVKTLKSKATKKTKQ
jgi:TfoX/Sxy family transcriptional regulator of competence genes